MQSEKLPDQNSEHSLLWPSQPSTGAARGPCSPGPSLLPGGDLASFPAAPQARLESRGPGLKGTRPIASGLKWTTHPPTLCALPRVPSRSRQGAQRPCPRYFTGSSGNKPAPNHTPPASMCRRVGPRAAQSILGPLCRPQGSVVSLQVSLMRTAGKGPSS